MKNRRRKKKRSNPEFLKLPKDYQLSQFAVGNISSFGIIAWILATEVSLFSSEFHSSFDDTSMPHRKSNESVVETTEEEDGTDYNATNKAEGPTWTQNGVDLRDEDWAQRPCSTSRHCQPAHVHTLQRQPQPIHQTQIKLFISHF